MGAHNTRAHVYTWQNTVFDGTNQLTENDKEGKVLSGTEGQRYSKFCFLEPSSWKRPFPRLKMTKAQSIPPSSWLSSYYHHHLPSSMVVQFFKVVLPLG